MINWEELMESMNYKGLDTLFYIAIGCFFVFGFGIAWMIKPCSGGECEFQTKTMIRPGLTVTCHAGPGECDTTYTWREP